MPRALPRMCSVNLKLAVKYGWWVIDITIGPSGLNTVKREGGGGLNFSKFSNEGLRKEGRKRGILLGQWHRGEQCWDTLYCKRVKLSREIVKEET